MQVRKILILATAGVSLAGLLATAAPAGAAKPAAAAKLAKTSLVTRSGATVSPAAAVKLAGAAANVRGHDSQAPLKPIARTGTGMRPNSVIGTDSRTQVTAGVSLAGLLATAAPAGAAKPAAAAKLAKTSLVTRSGATVTPAAAVKLAGAAANVRGHDSQAPLKPIARAGTGMRPNSVIGTDSRTQVTATTTFPNSAIVLINRNGSLWCTGWMVGKDTLLSAGHCVTNGAGTWYSGLTFVPGSNGGNAPFGTCGARGIYAFSAWANGADSNYDTSIVKLNCTVGYSTGWFGTWWQSASLDGTFTRVQGYPGDKPSTQWQSFDYVRSSSADRLYYQNDTVGGESGSPVWQYRSGPYCSGACGMGVHTNGSNGTNNSGTRFTQGKLNAIYGIVNAA